MPAMFIVYYHTGSAQTAALIEAAAMAVGGRCEVDPDQDGIGVTVYAPDQLAVNGLRLMLWEQPLWRRPAACAFNKL
jgi:hypothetical protein